MTDLDSVIWSRNPTPAMREAYQAKLARAARLHERVRMIAGPVRTPKPEVALPMCRARPQPPSEPLELQMRAAEDAWAVLLAKCGRIPIPKIQRAVADYYDVSMLDLLSSRRSVYIVKPRQIAMYLAKTLTGKSLPEIGRMFGGRDHTTVLHAIRKYERLIIGDSTIAEEIETIRASIEGANHV